MQPAFFLGTPSQAGPLFLPSGYLEGRRGTFGNEELGTGGGHAQGPPARAEIGTDLAARVYIIHFGLLVIKYRIIDKSINEHI